MSKLKMHSPNLVHQNIERIQALFPHCVTEAENATGEIELKIDFDLLKQELSETIVEGPQERFHLNWPSKRRSMLTSNASIAKTLRPARDESVDFDTTRNLFIEGDNLDALKLLQETYLGKVKMIYIDPPYNTGNDFIYNDDFAEDAQEYLERSQQKDEDGNRLTLNPETSGRYHSAWLSMMYPRLRLARNLLREDGVIFISIDDGEIAHLRKLCDEVFGSYNFLATIIWEKVHTRKNSAKTFSVSHDYILAYAHTWSKWDRNLLPREGDARAAYKNPDNDPKGPWKADPITAHNEYSAEYIITKPNGVKLTRPSGRYWAFSEESWKAKVEANEVLWGEGESYPMIKRYLSEVQDGLVPTTLFFRSFAGDSSMARRETSKRFSSAGVFDYPKPTKLLRRLLQIATRNNEQAIVLDFFAGSGAMADGLLQQNAEDGGNRQFIMVQWPEKTSEKSAAFKSGYRTIADLSKERIRRAGTEIRGGGALDSNCHESWNKDIGFRVLKIDSSNMKDMYYAPDELGANQLELSVSNIKDDRTEEDLLFQVMLDWGVDLTLPIERTQLHGKTVYSVAQDALVACFDASGGVDEIFVKALAKAHQPVRVVFRDAGFQDDAARINVREIFKMLSPHTEVRTI